MLRALYRCRPERQLAITVHAPSARAATGVFSGSRRPNRQDRAPAVDLRSIPNAAHRA